MRLPSLEVGAVYAGATGNCEDGFSCAYLTNLAWSGPTTFLPRNEPARRLRPAGGRRASHGHGERAGGRPAGRCQSGRRQDAPLPEAPATTYIARRSVQSFLPPASRYCPLNEPSTLDRAMTRSFALSKPSYRLPGGRSRRQQRVDGRGAEVGVLGLLRVPALGLSADEAQDLAAIGDEHVAVDERRGHLRDVAGSRQPGGGLGREAAAVGSRRIFFFFFAARTGPRCRGCTGRASRAAGTC